MEQMVKSEVTDINLSYFQYENCLRELEPSKTGIPQTKKQNLKKKIMNVNQQTNTPGGKVKESINPKQKVNQQQAKFDKITSKLK